MTTIFEDKDPVNQNIVDKDTLRNVSQIFLSFFSSTESFKSKFENSCTRTK